MGYVKWTVVILFWLLVGSALHYTLPQTDIVRITDTYESRIEVAENPWFWSQSGRQADGTILPRDVFFIQTRRADGNVMVYRNEDTGWGWPPYFKFDTANLQAEAADLRSTAEDPAWMALRHYGWRVELFSIYPNAIALSPVDGPDVRIIPWTRILILLALAAVVYAVWVRWVRFRENRIEPALDSVGDTLDDGTSWLRGLFGGKR